MKFRRYIEKYRKQAGIQHLNIHVEPSFAHINV